MLSFTPQQIDGLCINLRQAGFWQAKLANVFEVEDDFRQFYQNFLTRYNRHANETTPTLSYLENIDAKFNIQAMMPHAKTILALRLPYSHSEVNFQLKQSRYKIARYAWGNDYHNTMKKILKPMLKDLLPARIICDSTPLPERYIARYLDLGFIGRNGMLIDSQKGSYFFLAFVLFGRELPLQIEDLIENKNFIFRTEGRTENPSRRQGLDINTDFENFCGSCRRCIDACPTMAIQENGLLNIAACLSYKTIESKDDIISTLADDPKNKNKKHRWIFGCDVCQMVCPYNRGKEPSDLEVFKPIDIVKAIASSGALENLTDQDLYGSALKRRGLKGLACNIELVSRNL